MWKNLSKIQTLAFIGQKGFPSGFPGTSGVELYVEKKIYRLASQKKRVICYTRPWTTGPKYKFKNISIHTLPTWNTKHLDAFTHTFLATIHAILIERVDEVWYQGIGPGVWSVFARFLGVKTALTIHTLDWKRGKWGRGARLALRICERLSVANANTIYVVSKNIQQYVNSIYQKNSVLDQLVLPRRPKPSIRRAKTFLRSYNTKPFNYILFMGRFVPEKRIEWAIRAFQELHRSNLNFLIVGGNAHTPTYERLVRTLAVGSPRIHLLGYMFGKEKSYLLAYAKFLVLPSEVEGFPVVVTEALQYNTPCLVPGFLKNEYAVNQPVHYFHHQSYEDFLKVFRRLAKDSNS